MIPLEIGGAPSDPQNLWMEPIGPAAGRAEVVAWKQAHG